MNGRIVGMLLSRCLKLSINADVLKKRFRRRLEVILNIFM